MEIFEGKVVKLGGKLFCSCTLFYVIYLHNFVGKDIVYVCKFVYCFLLHRHWEGEVFAQSMLMS